MIQILFYLLALLALLIGTGAIYMALIESFPVKWLYYHYFIRKPINWTLFLMLLFGILLIWNQNGVFPVWTIIPLLITGLALVLTYKMHQSKAILQYISSSGFTFSGSYKINPKIERGQLPFPTALMRLSSDRSWLPVLAERPSNYPSCLPWKGERFPSHFIALNDSACVSSSSSSSLPLVCGSEAYFTHPCAHLESDKPEQCLVPHLKHVIACK